MSDDFNALMDGFMNAPSTVETPPELAPDDGNNPQEAPDDTESTEEAPDDTESTEEPTLKQRQRRTKNQRIQALREKVEAFEQRALAAEQRALAAEQRTSLREGEQSYLTPETSLDTSDDVLMPDPDAYEFGGLDPAFTRDTLKALKDAATRAVQKELSVFEQQRHEANADAMLQARANEVLEAGINKYADYEEIVVEAADAGEFDLPVHLVAAIFENDNAPDILYQLASDNGELDQIMGMSPSAQLMAIGRLSAQLTSETVKPPRVLSKAPRPITAPKGASTSKDPTDDQTMAALVREFSS